MITNITPKPNDWRRQGQSAYLTEVKLIFRDYQPFRLGWDHDHCEFCGTKLSLNEGELNNERTSPWMVFPFQANCKCCCDALLKNIFN